MALNMASQTRRTTDGQYILSWEGSTETPLEWFTPDFWRSSCAVFGQAPGRGETLFLEGPEGPMVLRHYRRGGLMARFSEDRYLWLGAERSRSWQEWRLLARLREMGLPVPRPLAALASRQGLSYRADILIEFLPGTRALADLLAEAPQPESLWVDVGRVIGAFHAAGLDHADLNARNILIHPQAGVYLIDFDKSRLRPPAAGWQQANLARLQRSLLKFQRLTPAFHHTAAGWEALLGGYREGLVTA